MDASKFPKQFLSSHQRCDCHDVIVITPFQLIDSGHFSWIDCFNSLVVNSRDQFCLAAAAHSGRFFSNLTRHTASSSLVKSVNLNFAIVWFSTRFDHDLFRTLSYVIHFSLLVINIFRNGSNLFRKWKLNSFSVKLCGTQTLSFFVYPALHKCGFMINV